MSLPSKLCLAKVNIKLYYRSMYDVDGPMIARIFYRELFKDRIAIANCDYVARALDAAVAELRKELPVHRWAAYIHIGV